MACRNPLRLVLAIVTAHALAWLLLYCCTEVWFGAGLEIRPHTHPTLRGKKRFDDTEVPKRNKIELQVIISAP